MTPVSFRKPGGGHLRPYFFMTNSRKLSDQGTPHANPPLSRESKSRHPYIPPRCNVTFP